MYFLPEQTVFSRHLIGKLFNGNFVVNVYFLLSKKIVLVVAGVCFNSKLIVRGISIKNS